MRFFTLLFTALTLNACVAQKGGHIGYLERQGIKNISGNGFAHCRGYGCKYVDEVTLTKEQWRDITSPFRIEAKTPKQERKQIGQSIALFEKHVGEITGTHVDIYGTFIRLGTYQQDCVDESTNTTIYLHMLEQQGLMKYHATSSPAVRVPVINYGRWPHQTATIIEKQTEQHYVVDSWLHNNGIEPEITTVSEWRKGIKGEGYEEKIRARNNI